jgi:2-polyprenyl-3-methyl-5-hydroxy-6-metoxy-1,4-benzoquinol methylase
MSTVPTPSADSFQRFVAQVTAPAFVEQLASGTAWDPPELADRMTLAAGEAAQTLRVLAGLDVAPGERMLEVGAGLGLTSAYLSTTGFDVTALEPAGLGFAEHREMAARIARLTGASHDVLSIGAEDLRRSTHGSFAVVFSNNVLEHVPEPRVALSNLAGVMSPAGVMVHSCPNYTIPFEPHFGLPLLPFRPAATRRVLPRSVRDSDVWRSLNFVRARDVDRVARDLGLSVHFRSGSLASSLERLSSDEAFRQRHRLLGAVGAAARRLGLIGLARRLPARWSTPMDFLVASPDTDPGAIERWLHGLRQSTESRPS